MVDWKKLLTNSWMNNANVLAQIGHVLWGIASVVTAAYLGGPWYAIGIAGLDIVYAGFKEFWYDANYELPKQTTFDNVLDFSMYCIGVALGLFITFAKFL